MPMIIRDYGLPLDQVMSRLLTASDWLQIGQDVRARIVERTRSGHPPDGFAWPGYTRAYADRKFTELGAGPVNLTVSGEMLNNIQILEFSDTHVVVGWSR